MCPTSLTRCLQMGPVWGPACECNAAQWLFQKVPMQVERLCFCPGIGTPLAAASVRALFVRPSGGLPATSLKEAVLCRR
ncbi:hypothetical protein TYRP_007403 [Tyrophagus putrescentiae]|nr:hypothetical protein TYRP_007403 [Tyrophagus putrescentiae]